MGLVEVVAVIAGIAVALLLIELLLPTGGVLALIGAAGLVAAGIVALGDDSEASDYIGPALITLGVLSIATFLIITPKIVRAHRDERGQDRLGGADRPRRRGSRADRPPGPGVDRGRPVEGAGGRRRRPLRDRQ